MLLIAFKNEPAEQDLVLCIGRVVLVATRNAVFEIGVTEIG